MNGGAEVMGGKNKTLVVGALRKNAHGMELGWYGRLPNRERDEFGKRIVENAAATPVKRHSQADIDMWIGKLLKAYDLMGSHIY
jgi:hypothetical protein